MNDWIEIETKHYNGNVLSKKKNGKWVLFVEGMGLPSMNICNCRYVIDIPSKKYKEIFFKFDYLPNRIQYIIDENRQSNFRKGEKIDFTIKVERKQNKTNH